MFFILLAGVNATGFYTSLLSSTGLILLSLLKYYETFVFVLNINILPYLIYIWKLLLTQQLFFLFLISETHINSFSCACSSCKSQHTFHDFLQLHLQCDHLSHTWLIQTSLDSVDRQASLGNRGNIIIFQEYHLVCVLNDSAGK